MNWTASSAMVLAIVFSVVASGAELKLETAHEWDAYLVRVNARTMGCTQHDFLWVDDSNFGCQ